MSITITLGWWLAPTIITIGAIIWYYVYIYREDSVKTWLGNDILVVMWGMLTTIVILLTWLIYFIIH